MKRLSDIAAVMLFAVMLSACGKQSGETLAGQTETSGLTEQAENPEKAVEEKASGSMEPVEGSFTDEEEMQIQEDSDAMVNDITFDFETKTVMLNSGYEMPIYGLGTYSLTGETCVDSVTAALDRGNRLIDTAYMYHNEESVGEAVRNSAWCRDGIPWVAGDIPQSFWAMRSFQKLHRLMGNRPHRSSFDGICKRAW